MTGPLLSVLIGAILLGIFWVRGRDRRWLVVPCLGVGLVPFGLVWWVSNSPVVGFFGFFLGFWAFFYFTESRLGYR